MHFCLKMPAQILRVFAWHKAHPSVTGILSNNSAGGLVYSCWGAFKPSGGPSAQGCWPPPALKGQAPFRPDPSRQTKRKPGLPPAPETPQIRFKIKVEIKSQIRFKIKLRSTLRSALRSARISALRSALRSGLRSDVRSADLDIIVTLRSASRSAIRSSLRSVLRSGLRSA